MEHKLEQDVLHLTIRRDVLSTGVRDLFERLHAIQKDPQVQQPSWSTLELDLTRAKMIDSMGLNFIVHILKWSKGETRRPEF